MACSGRTKNPTMSSPPAAVVSRPGGLLGGGGESRQHGQGHPGRLCTHTDTVVNTAPPTQAKPHARANYSFSNSRLHNIERENQRLVGRLEAIARQRPVWAGPPGAGPRPNATLSRRKAEASIARVGEIMHSGTARVCVLGTPLSACHAARCRPRGCWPRMAQGAPRAPPPLSPPPPPLCHTPFSTRLPSCRPTRCCTSASSASNPVLTSTAMHWHGSWPATSSTRQGEAGSGRVTPWPARGGLLPAWRGSNMLTMTWTTSEAGGMERLGGGAMGPGACCCKRIGGQVCQRGLAGQAAHVSWKQMSDSMML